MLLSLIAVETITTAGTAYGSVIFSNLNPDPANLYDCCFQWVADNGEVRARLAMPFTAAAPGFSWTLTQIDLALREDLGGSFAATLTLNADSNGLPGNIVASWTLTNLPPNDHSKTACCELTTLIVPSPAASVVGGSKYWLVVSPIGSTSADLWSLNNTGSKGVGYSSDNLGNWVQNGNSTLGAFDVLGTTVPETSTFWLLLIGAAGLFRVLPSKRLAAGWQGYAESRGPSQP